MLSLICEIFKKKKKNPKISNDSHSTQSKSQSPNREWPHGLTGSIPTSALEFNFPLHNPLPIV